jgi:hypothetical protein
VPRCLSEELAQMRLVSESALQRYIAQGRFSLQHVLSRQLDASPDHEGMRWLSEGVPRDRKCRGRRVLRGVPVKSAPNGAEIDDRFQRPAAPRAFFGGIRVTFRPTGMAGLTPTN